MLTQLINKEVPIREPVLQDALVFLVKAHLKPVLGYSSEVDHYEVDFCNIHIKLCKISTEVEATLEQKVIKLVSVRIEDGKLGFYFIFFHFPFISFYFFIIERVQDKENKSVTLSQITCSCDTEKGVEGSGTR